MTDTLLALLLTVGFLAVLAVWVPLLHGLEKVFRRTSRAAAVEKAVPSERTNAPRYGSERVA